jgi:hypothetical protein
MSPLSSPREIKHLLQGLDEFRNKIEFTKIQGQLVPSFDALTHLIETPSFPPDAPASNSPTARRSFAVVPTPAIAVTQHECRTTLTPSTSMHLMTTSRKFTVSATLPSCTNAPRLIPIQNSLRSEQHKCILARTLFHTPRIDFFLIVPHGIILPIQTKQQRTRSLWLWLMCHLS